MTDDIDDDDIDLLLETPSLETYQPLQEAFDEFNRALFDGKLPECMLTLQRKDKRSHSYFAPARFARTNGNGYTVDVIAMNPAYFSGEHGGTREVLQTLAHEMAHLWQHHF